MPFEKDLNVVAPKGDHPTMVCYVIPNLSWEKKTERSNGIDPQAQLK